MENQGTVKVKFPRETDTKSGWTIDSSFLSRVRHSIPPDEDEWVPSHEEVQAVLMALEIIPAGIFTKSKVEQEPMAMQMDVIVVNLVREGINKHRARELAEHFIKHTSPPQRQQEPVAWMDDFGNAFPLAANKGAGSWMDEHKRNWKPLYTFPPQRQPLTDEQIADIVVEMNGNEPTALFWRDLARAIEAAHGIKGEA